MPSAATGPQPITSVVVLEHELRLETPVGRLAVTPYTARTIRVRFTTEASFSASESLVVVATPEPAARFEVEETPSRVVFRTAALVIEIDRATGAFTYRDADGGLLTREPARGGKTLEPVDVFVSVFDPAAVTQSRVGADGVRVDAVDVRRVRDRSAYHTKLEFEWADGEALYGLGSHDDGLYNLRGRTQYLYQQNMKAVVPVIVSTRGYGVFVDSTSLLTFHDDASGSYLWSDVDDEMDYYFVVGPELDTIVAELRSLTGAAPMPPRWAFGYLQSKERYESQAELLEVAREYRARGLPLDGIVLDWKSWTGDLWGQKTMDPERFPDPDAMTAALHDDHVHLMISVWPIMRPGGPDWQELDAAGLLLGNRATYDAFNPAARAMYWAQAERGLFNHGIDAWWTDCTEPFEADWKGPIKPEPEERLRINVDEAKRYLDPERINAYSLLHSEGIWKGQRASGSGKRVVNLTRSAFLGQQRYATVTWSGDLCATWPALRREIAAGLSFSATGMPYWTTDVGAFFVRRDPALWFWAGEYDSGVDDPGYRELYLRWFQFGAFLPMLRSHGTDTPREVWRFGAPGDPVYEALAAGLRLRSRLVPYLYSLAGWTTRRSYTMLRGLPFDFRTDPSVHDVDDQFLLGPALMVSPVTRPQAFGPGGVPITDPPTTRQVVLPAGPAWYDFWTDERHDGGQVIDAATPLDHIPVHVRAGSILPLGPVRQHVGQDPDAPLELHVYPGADAAFDLYEDEGDGYAYEAGACSVIPIRYEDGTRSLAIEERQGAWPGMSVERSFTVVLHDGAAGPVQTVRYAGASVRVRL